MIIAILKGVNASDARKLYRYGIEHEYSQKVLKRKQKPDGIQRKKTRRERKETMQGMRKEGFTMEAIAEAFDCDTATVRRSILGKR